MRALARLYWRFLRAHLAEYLQYRITIYLWALWWFVQLFAYMMVWATVAGVRSVGGFDRSAFVAYYLVLMVVGRLTRSIDMWTLEHEIRLGRLTPKLLWPADRLHESVTRWLSSNVINITLLLPVIPVLILVMEPRFELTPARAVSGLAALAIGMGIGFLWGHIVALVAFWTVQARAFYRLYSLTAQLLGGVVAPLAILPAGLAAASRLLPFYYSYGWVVESFTGDAFWGGLPVAMAWLVGGLIVRQLVWRAGLRQYTAVGA